jgi:hypothetical protein
MAAQTTTITRDEIGHLAGRLEARAQSRLMAGTPELQSDIRIAAIVLQAAIRIGFPLHPIAIDIGRDRPQPARIGR